MTAAAVVVVVVALLVGGRLLGGDRDGDTVPGAPPATPATCSEAEAGPRTEQPDGRGDEAERDELPCPPIREPVEPGS